MSLRELVDADCGGANALMRMGSHFSRDHAHKDEGLGGASSSAAGMARNLPAHSGDPMVNEFLGQVRAMPPQTFRMDALLQEMRDIDAQQFHAHLARAPPVIDEVHRGAVDWAKEFAHQGGEASQQQQYQVPSSATMMAGAAMAQRQRGPTALAQHQPAPSSQPWDMDVGGAMFSRDFFDAKFSDQIPPAADAVLQTQHNRPVNDFTRYLQSMRDRTMPPFGGAVGSSGGTMAAMPPGTMLAKDFFDQQPEQKGIATASLEGDTDALREAGSSWAQDFEDAKQGEFEATQDYNTQFWNRLHSEWKKVSEDQDPAHPWLSDLDDFYDPYKQYTFDADNPMLDIPDALARGRAFLAAGDLPSAILCFESAVKQEPDNAEIWELLGQSQAENEKDPNAIAALKRSLALQPNNANAMMTLAVSYTNESMQAQALSTLIEWLHSSETYRALVPDAMLEQLRSANDAMSLDGGAAATNSTAFSTVARGPELRDVQNVFLRAVLQSQPVIDASIQEALGVLFNLSSEYDKAVDCFRAALSVRPDSSKLWNRLGATLANGNRSVEAVEAYQRALHLQPGFIRARYNVGILCVNLKAYREATEHFLTALNQQATSLQRSGMAGAASGGENGAASSSAAAGTQMSDTIWSTMRMAVSLLGRSDLMPALEMRDLGRLNSEFGGSDASGSVGGEANE